MAIRPSICVSRNSAIINSAMLHVADRACRRRDPGMVLIGDVGVRDLQVEPRGHIDEQHERHRREDRDAQPEGRERECVICCKV